METKKVRNIEALGFQWKALDPFLFCVHHDDRFPKGNSNMGVNPELLQGRNLGQDFIVKDGFRMYHGKQVPGFPGHPHRGFETVTVVRKGMVDHSDSLGAAGRYGNGDVQWMTAGQGLQHSEMFPLIHQHKENPLELFQIWINLPRNRKMVEAHFKMHWAENMPVFKSIDDSGKETKVEIIAGKIGDKIAQAPAPNSWAANPDNEVAIWNILMQANASFELPKASEDANRMLYFYAGDHLEIDGIQISNYHSAELSTSENLLLKNGNKSGNVLILQGKPIKEPVVQHGPFVMNSKTEILQAFEEYNQTQFGGWPWPNYEQVHDKNIGRFAKHADGTEERPG